jgi:hypothetical protein
MKYYHEPLNMLDLKYSPQLDCQPEGINRGHAILLHNLVCDIKGGTQTEGV